MVRVRHVHLTPKSLTMEELAQLMHVVPDSSWSLRVPARIAQIMKELKVLEGEDVVQTHASHDKSSQWTAPARPAHNTLLLH